MSTEAITINAIVQNGTPKSYTKQELTDQLIEKLFQGHKTFTEACKELGLTRNRGYRLWNAWKESEEARQIDCEWWDLYLTVKQENPDKALECLTRLKYRMITEKKELKATVKEIRLEWQLESNPSNQVQAASEAT